MKDLRVGPRRYQQTLSFDMPAIFSGSPFLPVIRASQVWPILIGGFIILLTVFIQSSRIGFPFLSLSGSRTPYRVLRDQLIPQV